MNRYLSLGSAMLLGLVASKDKHDHGIAHSTNHQSSSALPYSHYNNEKHPAFEAEHHRHSSPKKNHRHPKREIRDEDLPEAQGPMVNAVRWF